MFVENHVALPRSAKIALYLSIKQHTLKSILYARLGEIIPNFIQRLNVLGKFQEVGDYGDIF